MAEAIRVNFSTPMPLFSLRDPVLFPYAVRPLHIFEARYRQMIDECLDRQIAIASYAGDGWKSQCDTLPPLRPAVCVGHIVQQEALPDGRHNILLLGVCRAKIVEIIEPREGRLYPMCMLVPLESSDAEPPPMVEVRRDLRRLLTGPRLRRLRRVESVMDWFDRKDVSTTVLLELLGFALVMDGDLKYRLLAEANAQRRAGLIKEELVKLDELVQRAERQNHRSWPKGLSWN